MFGRGYVIDHLMSAHRAKQEERLYRVYVTDALKSHLKLNKRYYDFINTSTKSKDTRSGDEIAFDVIKKCGLRVVVGNGSNDNGSTADVG